MEILKLLVTGLAQSVHAKLFQLPLYDGQEDGANSKPTLHMWQRLMNEPQESFSYTLEKHWRVVHAKDCGKEADVPALFTAHQTRFGIFH